MELTRHELIEEAKNIHSNTYGIPKYKYHLVGKVKEDSEVSIFCPIDGHGKFRIIFANHLFGEGCPKCAGTGYRGRTAIFEMFQYTDELKEVFLRKRSLESLRAALRDNKSFRTLREDGMVKVVKGLTTVEEVLRVC